MSTAKRTRKPPRIVVVIKRGMVESVHVAKRIAHADVIVLDKDNEGAGEGEGLEDPDIAEDHYTERLVEVETSEAQQPIFTNHYRHCGESWQDEWSCGCNDACPKCGAEIEPHKSTVREGTP